MKITPFSLFSVMLAVSFCGYGEEYWYWPYDTFSHSLLYVGNYTNRTAGGMAQHLPTPADSVAVQGTGFPETSPVTLGNGESLSVTDFSMGAWTGYFVYGVFTEGSSLCVSNGLALGSDGEGYLTISGGEHTVGGTVRLGGYSRTAKGGGQLTVTGGSLDISGYVNLGAATAWKGTNRITVTGSGRLSAAYILAGEAVYGEMFVTNGGTATAKTLYVGCASNTVNNIAGRLVVADEGVVSVSNNNALAVGTKENATGTVYIDNGGQINAVLADNTKDACIVGWYGEGALTVTNRGALTVQGLLHSGCFVNSTGTVTVAEGGRVTVQGKVYAGRDIGATGSYVLDGDARLVTDSEMYVGLNGTGSLALRNGAFLGTKQLFAGRWASSTGTVTVANATLSSQKECTIGYAGIARVTLEEGGTLISTNEWCSIAASSGKGELILRGGTVLLNNNDLGLQFRPGGESLLRGWGTVTGEKPYRNIPRLRFYGNARVIADGEGAERDLSLNDISTDGKTSGYDYGLYAVNKGRLLITPRAKGNYVYPLGECFDVVFPEIVNTLSVTNVPSGKFLRGCLYATDRSDIPAGIPGTVRTVWRIGFFTDRYEDFAVATPSSFSTEAEIRFRCDVTEEEVSDMRNVFVLLRYNPVTQHWDRAGRLHVEDNRIVHAPSVFELPTDAENRFNLGWFALSRIERTGMIIQLR